MVSFSPILIHGPWSMGFSKFVQNPEKSSLEFVKDWFRLKSIMTDPSKELLDIQYTPGDRTVAVSLGSLLGLHSVLSIAG